MTWFIYAILQFLFMLVCYVTNPIVVLFADEVGQLPSYLKWWQTHDNPCDIEWMITEDIVPKWAQYDFNRHYKYHEEDKGDGYMIAGYVELLDPNFTLKERLQRYYCRVRWLYRNCGYGFAYNICGRDCFVKDDEVLQNYDNGKGDRCTWIVSDNAWCFYLEKQYSEKFYLRVYLGHKMKGLIGCEHTNRAMLALHCNPWRTMD